MILPRAILYTAFLQDQSYQEYLYLLKYIMFYLSLLTMLAVKALAGPLLPDNPMPVARSPSSEPGYISACEAADNCETYIDPASGYTNIRFKTGMEPGSDDYKSRVANSRVKRQSGYPKTLVTVGDATIFWGCDVDPVETLAKVGDICATSGSCVSNAPYSKDVTYVVPGQTSSKGETLTIGATGTYPTWIRNGLVKAVQAAMSGKGIVHTTKVEYGVATGVINRDGIQLKDESCNVAKAPSFIGLGVFSAVNVLEATMQVTATMVDPEPGFCGSEVGDVAALTGAIVGAFGAVGAALAAIFGVVSATCALAS